MYSFLQLRRPMLATIVACTLAVSITGCAELIIGSAVVSAVSAADRRTIGSQTEDKMIALKADTIVRDVAGTSGQIEVTSYNRRVLLTGIIVNETLKADLERKIAAIQNVQGVTNDVEIGDYTQSLASRSQDAVITAKVKTALAQKPGLQSSLFKVVTVKGHVYLMGLVTQVEGDSAAEAARHVGGVTKIMKMFEYITEDQVVRQAALRS